MAFKESLTNPHIFAKSLFARKTEPDGIELWNKIELNKRFNQTNLAFFLFVKLRNEIINREGLPEDKRKLTHKFALENNQLACAKYLQEQ